ncbi:dehydration-responsive element-binding protein 1E-like [Lotus japonicus]|uniref:dehydration-responsive element-binding protein 1E-like n=1 Tax=Lotus japonicus TaxID=34305 RepID=UPI00258F7F80|nr:dehydration-responsive element-binding protein 1E-like [Lotus japonicus]
MNSLEESSYEHYSCSSSETTSSSSNRNEEAIITLASAKPKRRAGRRIFKETRHPVYRGVRRRNNDKWVCEARVPNEKNGRIWLGTYPTPEMAARAHDVAALALRVKSACLNFADSAWRIPPLLPASNCKKEIRRVAGEVAEAFVVEDIDGDEVCSSNSVNENEKPLQLKGLCLDIEVLGGVSSGLQAEQELHDWLRRMVDEPLRSPQHAFVGSYGWDWSDVQGDTEVSLWSFAI